MKKDLLCNYTMNNRFITLYLNQTPENKEGEIHVISVNRIEDVIIREQDSHITIEGATFFRSFYADEGFAEGWKTFKSELLALFNKDFKDLVDEAVVGLCASVARSSPGEYGVRIIRGRK